MTAAATTPPMMSSGVRTDVISPTAEDMSQAAMKSVKAIPKNFPNM